VGYGRRGIFFIGMTLFQAWICAINSAPVVAQAADNLVLRITHTGGILTVLVLLIIFRRWAARRIAKRPFAIAVGALAVVGTLLVESSYLVDALPRAVAIVGALLTASSTGALLVAWGEGYARLPDRAEQANATLAALPASFVVYLLVATFPVALSLVVVSALPVAIVVCLWRLIGTDADASTDANTDADTDANTDANINANADKAQGSAVRTAVSLGAAAARLLRGLPDRMLLRLMLYIMIISIPLNYLNIFLGERMGAAGNDVWPSIYSIALFVFIGVVLLEALTRGRGVTVLPTFVAILITAGLLLHFFLNSPFLLIMSLMTSGYSLFVAIFYCYLGSNTLLGERAPFLVFAFGNCANTVGQTLGWLIGWLVGWLAGGLLLPLASYIAVAIVYVVLVVGLLLLPSRGNFFGRKAEEADAAGAALGETGEAPTRGAAQRERSATPLIREAQKQCRLIASVCSLSSREEQILEYLVRGRSLETIATEIGLSRNTIKTHTEHIYHKLGVHTREELIIRVEDAAPDTSRPIEERRENV
jgi:DNA-binding CsgD family transcriptional regulator